MQCYNGRGDLYCSRNANLKAALGLWNLFQSALDPGHRFLQGLIVAEEFIFHWTPQNPVLLSNKESDLWMCLNYSVLSPFSISFNLSQTQVSLFQEVPTMPLCIIRTTSLNHVTNSLISHCLKINVMTAGLCFITARFPRKTVKSLSRF